MSENSENAKNDGIFFIKAERKCRINKWRIREGYPVNAGMVVCTYEILDDNNAPESGATKKYEKLKTNRHAVVRKRFYEVGDIAETGANLLELAECMHTTIMKDMCALCGCDLRQNEKGNKSEASVPMIHSIPELKVTQKLAKKFGQDDTRRLLETRKLVLLVDLDQTVIHTTNDNVPNNIKGIYHFQLYGPNSPWYHTRLRPGTKEFLETISAYYELHICTFGARNYAHMIAKILDPDEKFFSNRILSRDECFNATSKTDNLKALFPNGDSMVCIIDDREDVWNMASNLIQVKPYHFFQHTGDINAPPGLSKHELDGEGLDFKDLNSLNEDNEKNKQEEVDAESKNSIETQEKLQNVLTNKELKSNNKPDTTEVVGNDAAATKDMTIKIATVKDEATSTKAGTSLAAINDTDDTTASNVTNSDEKQIVTSTTEDAEHIGQLNQAVEEDKSSSKSNSNENLIETKNVENEQQQNKDGTDVIDITPKFTVPPTGDVNNQIEIEDPDDYLLYLEIILKNIHSRFYKIYDETHEIPDLKIIVPKIRSEVLRDSKLVFSGLVPTNMRLEQTRAYFIAKSLGASVAQNMSNDTTHLVAVTAGTFKVNAAKKYTQIKVVNSNWLWSCAERWEHVDERLFPLDRKTKSKQRQPPAHCHSPEHVVNYSEKSEISSSSSAQQVVSTEPEPDKFSNTINPLLLLSNDDLDEMNKEFHQFFESDDSSLSDNGDEPVNIENPPVDRNLRKRKREERDANRTHNFFTQSEFSEFDANKSSNDEEDGDANNDDDNDNDDDDDEMPSAKFLRGDIPSDFGSDSNDSDNNQDTEDDGDWNMMGAALEREFLGLED